MNWYGQRGEDARIFNLLGLKEGEKSRGFYIDIGAWLPDVDSVTKAFYDMGWSGINVEPVEEYHRLLCQARPRDINVQRAISNVTGWNTMTAVADSGLSTLHSEFGESARVGRIASTRQVRTVTLANLCDEFARGRHIDFLKIDVEGWERQVIECGDWDRYRPEIVVVEATVPMTDTPNWEAWEPILLANRYDFIEFDGLNRYYRAQ